MYYHVLCEPLTLHSSDKFSIVKSLVTVDRECKWFVLSGFCLLLNKKLLYQFYNLVLMMWENSLDHLQVTYIKLITVYSSLSDQTYSTGNARGSNISTCIEMYVQPWLIVLEQVVVESQSEY